MAIRAYVFFSIGVDGVTDDLLADSGGQGTLQRPTAKSRVRPSRALKSKSPSAYFKSYQFIPTMYNYDDIKRYVHCEL